jgi:peptidoglycan/xylan/chitin deacetylase (PgdA/CDA1 family)
MAPHGIMFHHFHDHRHPAGQGSLAADDLAAIIRFLNPDRILPAREWLRRAIVGTLANRDLCLTFDDNLRCQYDVARPVLRDFHLTAFWFVPTSVMEGRLERLEIYRQFRVKCFGEIDDFYEVFFRTLATSDYAEPAGQVLRQFDATTYLAEFPFYSEADRRFRYVRDEVLGPLRYQRMMDALIGSMGIELEALAHELWMEPEQVRCLHDEDHVIGLHTHTHPTCLARLPREDQLREYRDNYMYLLTLLGQPPSAVAHPCNSYNQDTLAILRRLGIKVGFRANTALRNCSELECPREDQANVLREMRRGRTPYAAANGSLAAR